MASVKFDNQEILSTTYIPRFVKHESTPERVMTLLNLAREDGSILVSEKYGTKRIVLRGYLTATTKALLETAIDNFKELFSRKEKNLDISWESGTRRYVATCARHEFDRDHFHILFVPWTAEFIVISGVGEATSETHYINNQAFTAVEVAGVWTFGGSAKPKPRIRLKCGVAATDPKGMSIENVDNGERIVMTRSAGFGAGKYFEADCRLKTAKYDGNEVAFYGRFPTFKVGANNYEIKVGNMTDQAMIDYVGAADNPLYGSLKPAETFTVPYTDSTYQGVELYLRKLGTLANDLTWRIETDNNGEPSGVLVHANATGTIAKGGVALGYAWLIGNSANPYTLYANTRYWLVLSTTGGDSGNCYIVPYNTGVNATYKRGHKAFYDGATWTIYPEQDMIFKILYGGKGDGAKTYYFDVYYFKRFL